jgi:hypothetical protein
LGISNKQASFQKISVDDVLKPFGTGAVVGLSEGFKVNGKNCRRGGAEELPCRLLFCLMLEPVQGPGNGSLPAGH